MPRSFAAYARISIGRLDEHDMATYLQCFVYGPLLHICARKMHNSVESILLLGDPRELETAFPRAAAGSPGHGHRQRAQRREPRDAGEQIFETLSKRLASTHVDPSAKREHATWSVRGGKNSSVKNGRWPA